MSLKCTVHNQTKFSSEHRESFNESWQNRNICLRNSKCQIFITLLPWIASILTHTTLWGPPDFLMTYGDTSLWSVRTSKVFCTRLLLLMLWGNFYISPFIRLSGQQQKKIQQGLCVVCKFPPSGQLCHCNKIINCNQNDVFPHSYERDICETGLLNSFVFQCIWTNYPFFWKILINFN